MRPWLSLLLVLLFSRGVAAQPLRVTIECEEEGRTKACPAFLLGFVDANPVLLQSPRATADVIVYANASEVRRAVSKLVKIELAAPEGEEAAAKDTRQWGSRSAAGATGRIAHVDLNISFSVTKRELPGPDESMFDPIDYALQSRLSYAEPLAINGSFNLSVHADRTNGERNDRFTDL